MQRPRPGPRHVAAQEGQGWTWIPGPGPPFWGTPPLGLPRSSENNPAWGGENPPPHGIEVIPGKSRNVRRSDSGAGINGNTHQLHKVRWIYASYSRLLYFPWISPTGKLTWSSECPRGSPIRSPSRLFCRLGPRAPHPRTELIRSARSGEVQCFFSWKIFLTTERKKSCNFWLFSPKFCSI